MRRILTALLLFALLFPLKAMALEPLRLKINPRNPQEFSPWVFGHNLEHTRATVNTGLSAQMLQNRKFAGKPSKNQGVAAHWKGLGDDNAFFKLNDRETYTRHYANSDMERENELQAQEIQNLGKGTMSGIYQEGLAVESGKSYDLSIIIRSTAPIRLQVSLTDPTQQFIYAERTFDVPNGTEWQKLECTLTPSRSDQNATVRYGFQQASEVVIGALSMLPSDHFHGMRRDVVRDLKEIGPSVLRWPGGNFAGEYRWKDGLLDVDMRGPLQAVMEIETQPYSDGYDFHEISTDDFIALCREIGAEPFLTINAVWDSPKESAEWVEYCNGDKSTPMGRLRAERGHDAPYGVRLWSLGNEMGYHHMEGPKGATGYADMAELHVAAMRQVTPDIQFWSSGPYPNDDWVRNSAARLSDQVQYISLHHYSSPNFIYGGTQYHYATPEDVERTYKQTMECAMETLSAARKMRQSLDATGKSLHLSLDEWNQWYAWYRPSCVTEGMFTARMMHMLIEESNTLDMPICCYFQPVGEGAILITPQKSELTANGQVFALMKAHKGGGILKVDGDGDYRALATLKDGILTLTLVNSDYHESQDYEIEVPGKVLESIMLHNEDVRPHTYFNKTFLTVQKKGKLLKVSVPAHGVARICLQVP